MTTKAPNKKEKLRFTKKTTFFLYSLLWLGALSPILAITLLYSTQSEEDLPSVEVLENPPELLASVIYADDGTTELGRYWNVNRTSVAYKDISPFVIDALISTEDERFLEHPGIDMKALGRAVYNMGSAGGGSTITQQLAKLLFTIQQRKKIQELKAQGKEIPKQSSGKMKRLNEKVKEHIIALRLERQYTKEEIVTMYLNQFDFLYNAVGIENAAKVYFNKKPIDLTKNEAAILVGMCKNPSLINPYTYQIKNYRAKLAAKNKIAPNKVSLTEIQELKSADSLRAIKRRNQVLYQWKRNSDVENPALKNTVTQAEYDSIIQQPITITYQIVDHKVGDAPYFRESLRSSLKKLFKETKEDGSLKYSKADGTPYNVYSDGLKIYTTININMQRHAEAALKRHLKEDLQPEFTKNNNRVRRYPFANYQVSDKTIEGIMSRGRKNSDRFRMLKDLGMAESKILETFEVETPMRVFSWEGEIDTILTPNDSIRYYKNLIRAGLVSIDPSTGFVKAWVGGANINHFAYDAVGQGKRQVGSTIKPFVYSTALTMGVVKPCTEFDKNSSFCVDVYGEGGKLNDRWCPKGKEFDNKTVAMGLATSDNLVTVAVMSKMGGYSGPKNISKLLRDVGIELRPEDEVPSMCLGIMSLSVLQMTAAQSMFVNQGIYTEPSTILRIEDRNGNVIYSANPKSKEVLNSYDAFTTLTMMKGVVQFGTGSRLRGSGKWGQIKYPMAGKTGTTQNNTDGWFMGLTPDLVTGIWVGAEDNAVRFSSMLWGQGARMALPIYGYYMQEVYKDPKIKISKEDFDVPLGYDPSRYECEETDNGSTFNPGI